MDRIQRVSWVDALIIMILACVASGTTFWRASALDPVIYVERTPSGYYPADMWFGGDIPKIVIMMRDRHSEQYNITSEHPLLPIATYLPVFLLRTAGGLGLFEAVRVYWAVLGALWVAALFTLFRLTGCRRVDATMLAVLGMTSAAAVFWFAVPEAFSVGSLTIVVAFCLVAAASRARSPLLAYSLGNLVSLSMTLTNWMVGILAAILHCHGDGQSLPSQAHCSLPRCFGDLRKSFSQTRSTS